ncbi:lipopolysaccharide biosynthesis protein [Pseudalkalibacillus caeni]|uniref:Flippase n=1 Tax=Exobacillus caeni TaxID=2574798 RepID=A0A5R9F3X0_9BACL|nr:flippase [Pseudalkalibacillus caeni]TLS35164.1 flippase [Pseudalkalibacillus caeni]
MIKKLLSSSLFRSSGIYTLTNMLNAAIPFLMMPVLTRYMTPIDYGIVAMFTVLIGFLNPFIGVNMHGAINRQYFERDKVDVPRYITNGLFVLAINTLFISIIVWLLAGKISKLTSFPAEWLWAVMLVAVFQVLVQIKIVLWQVQVKPIPYGLFQILQTSLNVGITLILVVGFGQGWQGRIEGQIIAVCLFGIIGLFLLWKNNWIKISLNIDYLKHLFSFGLPLIPHTVGALLITMVDRVFITNMVGVGATGLYTVGYQIGMIIGILQDSFNKAWVPWFYKKLKEDQYNDKLKIVRITYGYFVVIILIAMLLGLFSPWFLSFFVGKEFEDSSQFVIWIAIGFAFNGMYKMVTNYIFYLQKTTILMYTTFLTACLNLVFNYFFIKLNGAVGAAQATSLSFFITFVVTWVMAAKIYKMPWNLNIKG